jgi:hypothetical protein
MRERSIQFEKRIPETRGGDLTISKPDGRAQQLKTKSAHVTVTGREFSWTLVVTE